MLNDKKAEATISKRIVHARQFFKLAMRKGLVSSNPFTDVRTGSQKNPERLRFIDRATIDKIMDACPNLEWKLIVALSRYAGLRCPSETLSLKLTDLDWANDRLIIPSPKGERHGKGKRFCPMFPELKPLLNELWQTAQDGQIYVVTRYRDKDQANMRTQFQRILDRAGVESWPRLFHNLRASRQTELADVFPLHVVTAWMGNTPDIAAGITSKLPTNISAGH